jgi:hypothetical protein
MSDFLSHRSNELASGRGGGAHGCGGSLAHRRQVVLRSPAYQRIGGARQSKSAACPCCNTVIRTANSQNAQHHTGERGDESQKQLPAESIFYTDMAKEAAQSDSAGDYWKVYWQHLPNFGPLALNLSHQQSGQGASERLHNAEKRISTKTRNRLRPEVKEALTEVKMSALRKRSERVNEKKTYQRTDRVTVLGLVCEKMAQRVAYVRKEREDMQAAQSLARIHLQVAPEDDSGVDEGAEDEIWEVTDIPEEDLNEGEGEREQEVDAVAALLELAQWEEVEVED